MLATAISLLTLDANATSSAAPSSSCPAPASPRNPVGVDASRSAPPGDSRGAARENETWRGDRRFCERSGLTIVWQCVQADTEWLDRQVVPTVAISQIREPPASSPGSDTGERATRWRGHPINTHTHRLARRRIGSKTSPSAPAAHILEERPAGTSPSFCGRGKERATAYLSSSTSQLTVCISTLVPPVSLSPIWAFTSPVPPMTTLESS